MQPSDGRERPIVAIEIALAITALAALTALALLAV